jgi:dihydroxy-acid dehydratase
MPDDVRKLAIDKSRLPSRHVTVGPERAPHRAFLYSMGLTAEQIAQPLVGVATTWNEAAPCNSCMIPSSRCFRPRASTLSNETPSIPAHRRSHGSVVRLLR